MNNFLLWLQTWFQEHGQAIQPDVNDNFFDIGAIDSLGLIELIEDIEQAFEITFTQEDFLDRRFSSITGLAEILAEKQEK